ncbi:MAG: triphosphoribosyl-dephospho-CoA synthase, partial [Candidatus Lokiarchaeota archaeon]|nr:triphosphoribosyl-dephospho-CoA synthase [Candidatus Lokiarchaeota archaeon]
MIRCVNLSSLLELSGWPKPGNVHRTRNFEDTRFEHFLAGITAIQPNFRE